MASQAIQSLTEKDDEIALLQAEIQALKVELEAKPKIIEVTEKDFKAKVAPPPPPPSRPNRSRTDPVKVLSQDVSAMSDALQDMLGSPMSEAFPPPPPPHYSTT